MAKKWVFRVWGLAAMKAFIAYEDTTMLRLAIKVWDLINDYVIQPSEADSGNHPMKTARISPSCNGGSCIFVVQDLVNNLTCSAFDSVYCRGCFLCESIVQFNADF